MTVHHPILIVTRRGDVHADTVTGLLRRAGHHPLLVYPEEMLGSGGLAVRLDESGWAASLRQDYDSDPIGPASVRAVWWRGARFLHRA